MPHSAGKGAKRERATATGDEATATGRPGKHIKLKVHNDGRPGFFEYRRCCLNLWAINWAHQLPWPSLEVDRVLTPICLRVQRQMSLGGAAALR